MSMTSTEVEAPMATMTPERAEFFNREGYLTMGPILPPEKVNELDAYVTNLIKNPASDSRSDRNLNMMHPNHPYLLEFLTQESILDLVEPLIGPNIVLWASHFISKPPGVGKRVPWHQDSGYWSGLALPRKVVTIWLAVDDANIANGCMRVIPGTHHEHCDGYDKVDSTKNIFGNELQKQHVDETRAVDLELPSGHASFHDGWTIHGSNANTSAKRRCGFTMRYMPVEQECENKEHPLYLVRGEDRIGKNVYRNRS